jgi:trans-aconitate methyltransferase
LALARWWSIPVRSVLDVGAGPGWWGERLRSHHPSIRYTGTDVSAAACARYGHEQRDIATWQPSRQWDLVVCQGTLHYLAADECERAIAHLASATRGLALIDIPTLDDLQSETIDTAGSDLDAHWRRASWYRKILRRHLVELGCGLWVPADAPHRFYALEKAVVVSTSR